jgi:hypothetical protein
MVVEFVGLPLGPEQFGPVSQYLGFHHELLAHEGQHVGCPIEDQRGRAVLGQMQGRGDCLAQGLIAADLVHQGGNAAEAEHRIEEDKGVGFRGNLGVFPCPFEPRGKGRAGAKTTGSSGNGHPSAEAP